MVKRSVTALGLLAIFTAGGYLAYEASRLYIYRAGFAGSYTYDLFFTSANWVLPLIFLLGILFAATSIRQKAEINNGKVLRHDWVAFLIHWAHALSTVLLLVTGVHLGFLFVPRLVGAPESVGFLLNLHFVGVSVFLFSIAAHLTDLFVAGKLKEHLPESSDLQDAFAHYSSKFGIGTKPREGKYLASEKLSYPAWVVLVGLIVVTGVIKTSAHIWDLPAGVMGVTTFLHDLGALLLGLNLIVHIIMSSILPWSWPLLKSMVTGYVPVEYAKHHHVKWYEELSGVHVPDQPAKGNSRPKQQNPASKKGV